MELPSFFLFTATTVLAIFFTAAQFPRIMGFLRRQLPPQKLRQAGGVKENLLSTLAKMVQGSVYSAERYICRAAAGITAHPTALCPAAGCHHRCYRRSACVRHRYVPLPWAAMCLLLQQTPKAIALGAIYAVITLVRSFLEPKVMAAQVNLPPLQR